MSKYIKNIIFENAIYMEFEIEEGDTLVSIYILGKYKDWKTRYKSDYFMKVNSLEGPLKENAIQRHGNPDTIHPGDIYYIPIDKVSVNRVSRIFILEDVYIYFSIYYKVPDNAFKRAALTWKKEIEASQEYSEKPGLFIMKEVQTESQFKQAWDDVISESEKYNGKVLFGNLFTHASKSEESEQIEGQDGDGLEFKRDGVDGTINREELKNLPKLNWDENGHLTLSSCNSGSQGEREWSPASALAEGQNIVTYGFAGYAYFSTDKSKYVESNSKSKTMYLLPYNRGRNYMLGGIIFDAEVIEPVKFNPVKK